MRRFLCLLSVASVAFAPAPVYEPNPAKEDWKDIQGAWVMEYDVTNGVRTKASDVVVWLIEGNRLSTSLNGKAASVLSIALDPRTTPRSFDLWESKENGGHALGRYRLTGDVLEVSSAAQRPAGLSGDHPSDGVSFFRRKKP